MIKQYNIPNVLKATDKINKLLSFILANSEMEEEWKEIEWANGDYFISSMGRVLSLCNKQPRLLKAFICNGYLCVSICGHDRRINRLVANAFIPNPEEKPVVHHKNHIKTNNTVSNLAWTTHSENTKAYFDSKQREQNESDEIES